MTAVPSSIQPPASRSNPVKYGPKAAISIPLFLRNVPTLSRLPAAQEKGLALEMQVPAGLCAWADPKLLRRIVTNLLSNAVKFTKEGFVKVTAQDEEKQTVVRVQDSGVGLDEKQCAEIFEKYRQVDEKAEGYGLGLFISRQLARAHGGDLTVQSEAGKGSTFILTLPKEEA